MAHPGAAQAPVLVILYVTQLCGVTFGSFRTTEPCKIQRYSDTAIHASIRDNRNIKMSVSGAKAARTGIDEQRSHAHPPTSKQKTRRRAPAFASEAPTASPSPADPATHTLQTPIPTPSVRDYPINPTAFPFPTTHTRLPASPTTSLTASCTRVNPPHHTPVHF